MDDNQNITPAPLSEELGDFNTDLKELFMNMDYDAMQEQMAERPKEELQQVIWYNHLVVKKYFRSGKLDLIRKFLSFVAFSSFLVEYGVKAGVLESDEDPMALYQEIFDALQAESGSEQ